MNFQADYNLKVGVDMSFLGTCCHATSLPHLINLFFDDTNICAMFCRKSSPFSIIRQWAFDLFQGMLCWKWPEKWRRP